MTWISDLQLGKGDAGERKLLAAPVVFCVLVLAYLLFRQGVQGVPVATRPLEGEVHRGPSIRLCWTPERYEDVEVQIARERRFETVLYAQRIPGAWFHLTPPVCHDPGVYYWRMRQRDNAGVGTWTRAIRFRVD